MLYKEGYVYHIKDEYFEKVNDNMLMQNKENGTYRPTFYCLKDEKTSLSELWYNEKQKNEMMEFAKGYRL